REERKQKLAPVFYISLKKTTDIDTFCLWTEPDPLDVRNGNCTPNTMMRLKPKRTLTDQEVQRGLKMVIWDGLASEAVTSFTGGAVLVAIALLLGTSNIQIGLLASLHMITNLTKLRSNV